MSVRRQDIREEEVWNLQDIFKNEDEFQQAVELIDHTIEQMRENTEKMEWNESRLMQYLHARDALLEQCNRVMGYAMLRFSEDGTDPIHQALFARARNVRMKVEEQLTRERDGLLKLSQETLHRFAESEECKSYQLFLRELAESKAHVLHPEVEHTLAALGDVLSSPSTLYRTTTGADMRFALVADEQGQEFAVTPFSVLIRAESSTDKEFRQRAYESLVAGLKPYHHTLAMSLVTEIQKNVTLAKLRGYSSTADMLLHQSTAFGDWADQVPVSFFERVLNVFMKELAPQMRRYARLRSRVWGMERLHFWDVKAPLVAHSEHVPFSTVTKSIPEAVSPLGKDYQKLIERAFYERWIYRGDNIGALQGAYCYPIAGVHPYVFAPYHHTLYDMFIVAHELGHAGHAVLAAEHQVQQNRSSSRLFVEAPSTFHEHLLAHYLRSSHGEQAVAEIHSMQLLTFHHNFVTHLIEAELLRRLYRLADEGQPLTAGVLDTVQLDILKDFWGDSVHLDEGAEMTWMRQAHYYSGLYPYTYAVGLTASTVLAARLERGENVMTNWLEILKLGGSVHALDAFQRMDIDMNTEQPFQEAISYVGKRIDDLENLYP
ncbi:M3 family metallopeptidase [Alicyclobacillus tolerans]|uniref:Oligoendopeptidase F n=2 Tax=Alicyclobacillus tolerans TaxID=90970 RepID=A0A1M6QP83_9BACL|nr:MULTISPECIES: M3 family metallopeptidase [Alicyclobacillus]MDP9729418.1 oligoendopeptidase F [Alicyclobacillus tengchongensis]SHK21975.1 oligoendopeptidase F [Alicyclobacillus montanus]